MDTDKSNVVRTLSLASSCVSSLPNDSTITTKSTSEIKSRIIDMANQLLEISNQNKFETDYSIPEQIGSIKQINSNFFVYLYENICCNKLEDKKWPAKNINDEIHNVQAIIDTISIDILHEDLSHLTGEAICGTYVTNENGDLSRVIRKPDLISVEYLLDIIRCIHEWVSSRLESNDAISHDSNSSEKECSLVGAEINFEKLSEPTKTNRSTSTSISSAYAQRHNNHNEIIDLINNGGDKLKDMLESVDRKENGLKIKYEEPVNTVKLVRHENFPSEENGSNEIDLIISILNEPKPSSLINSSRRSSLTSSSTSESDSSSNFSFKNDSIDDSYDEFSSRPIKQSPLQDYNPHHNNEVYRIKSNKEKALVFRENDSDERFPIRKARNYKNELELYIEESCRKQQGIINSIKKDLLVKRNIDFMNQKKQTERDSRSHVYEERCQNAKIKKFTDEIERKKTSRLLQQINKDEINLKQLYNETFKIKRELMLELNRYAREKSSLSVKKQLIEIESIEKFYRTKFEILNECIKKEEREMLVREREQRLLVNKRKAEAISKIDNEIKGLLSKVYKDRDFQF